MISVVVLRIRVSRVARTIRTVKCYPNSTVKVLKVLVITRHISRVIRFDKNMSTVGFNQGFEGYWAY